MHRIDELGLLQTLLVSLDHLLDHLAADGAGLTGGQVTVVAVGQVDTDLPWCLFYLLNSLCKRSVGDFHTRRNHISNRFVHNFTNELVKDPDALLIAGIFTRHLLISFWEYFFTDFNAVNERNKSISI